MFRLNSTYRKRNLFLIVVNSKSSPSNRFVIHAAILWTLLCRIFNQENSLMQKAHQQINVTLAHEQNCCSILLKRFTFLLLLIYQSIYDRRFYKNVLHIFVPGQSPERYEIMKIWINWNLSLLNDTYIWNCKHRL